MTDTTTKITRLYSSDRLADYDTAGLETLFGMAHHDTQCPTSVYWSYTREQTITIAWRSCADIAIALRAKAADGDSKAVAAIDRLAAKLSDLAGEQNRQAVITYAGAPSATATAANILREIRGE